MTRAVLPSGIGSLLFLGTSVFRENVTWLRLSCFKHDLGVEYFL